MRKFVMIVLSFSLLFSCTPKEEPPIVEIRPLLEDMQENYVEIRPEWEGQLDLEDLKPGIFVFEVHKEQAVEVLILSSPYEINGQCYYDRVVFQDEEPWGYLTKTTCADRGLVEYTGRFRGWNKYNHLLLSDREPFSEERVEILRSNLQPDPDRPPNIRWFNKRIHLL